MCRPTGARYKQLVAAGLVGGEPRAIWVEDLLRTAREQGLQERISFTLAAPEAVTLAGADTAPAQVKRHVLEYSLSRVHDIEALQFIQRFHQDHASRLPAHGLQAGAAHARGAVSALLCQLPAHIGPCPSEKLDKKPKKND